MGQELTKMRCPWCEKVMLKSKVQVRRYNNDYGAVIERRCTNCGKVLAAYLVEEGDFLPDIRKFSNP